jgi:hypothetical protein
MRIYIAGSLAASAPQGPPQLLSTPGYSSKIGKDYWTTSRQWFNGTIDDVRIYNISLSGEEIKSLLFGSAIAGIYSVSGGMKLRDGGLTGRRTENAFGMG